MKDWGHDERIKKANAKIEQAISHMKSALEAVSIEEQKG